MIAMKTLKMDAVHRELQALYVKWRSLNPPKVVEWARKHPRSALHARFDWDDSHAAEQYRLWQARELITEVNVIYPDGKRRQVYVSPIPLRGTEGYKALVDVLSNRESRAQYVQQALDEYNRVGSKYKDLQELAGIRAAVEEAEAKTKSRERQAI